MGLQDNHKENPQIHIVPSSLWERGSGPIDFITPSLYIAQATHMTDEESVAQRLAKLQELEETRFLADFHQSIEKASQKSWHD
jgi:hypothetical protein